MYIVDVITHLTMLQYFNRWTKAMCVNVTKSQQQC